VTYTEDEEMSYSMTIERFETIENSIGMSLMISEKIIKVGSEEARRNNID